MISLEQKVVDACSKGATIAEAASLCGVSASTVDRILRQRRKSGVVVELKRGRPPKSKTPFVFRKRRDVVAAPDDTEVDEVYKVLAKTPFPHIEHLTDDDFLRRLEVFRRLPVFLDEHDTIRPRNNSGLDLCSPYFPHRYSAISKGQLSAVAAWADERVLKRAIRFQLRRGDPVAPRNVLRAVMMMCRTPNIFRPNVARYIYENFCPPGGRVWDPCMGYGGRLLGAFVAGVRYTGTDVDEATVAGNRRLAERLGANCDIVAGPAEHFDAPEVDLVFTSPPYFDRERYTTHENQSWKKYQSFEQWLDGFLRRVTDRARAVLRTGGHLVLNVADLRERGTIIPLIEQTIQTATLSGFVHVKTLKMPLAAVGRVAPTEPLLIFKPV